MTDLERNSRTLIVCLVVALGVLVPLRFVAEGQKGMSAGTAVLGEINTVREVVEAVPEENNLEAPYNQIENEVFCIESSEAQVVIDGLNQRIFEGGMTGEEMVRMYQTVEQIERQKCK